MTSTRKKNPLLIALLLSVLFIHVPLFLLLFFFGDRVAELDPNDALKQNAVIVDLKSSQNLPVADIAKPKREERPDKASVQSQYNSKVAKETTSNGRKPQGSPKAPALRPVANSSSMPLPDRSPPEKQNPPKKTAAPGMAKTTPALSEKPNLQEQLRALKDQQQNKEAKDFQKFASKTASLIPPPTNFSGGGEGEFLPDYKVGDRTYVNAFANPQVSYYVELKRKFKMTWNPGPSVRAQINQITKGKITVVMGVSVDASGKLAELRVIRGSGLTGYDAEARRTVTASAPFSKPPSYLLQKDGQVHMAWTFVVYL